MAALFRKQSSQQLPAVWARLSGIYRTANPDLQFLIQRPLAFNRLPPESLNFLGRRTLHHPLVSCNHGLLDLFLSRRVGASDSSIQFRRGLPQVSFKVVSGLDQGKGTVRTATHQVRISIIMPIILPATETADFILSPRPQGRIPTTGASKSRLTGRPPPGLLVWPHAVSVKIFPPFPKVRPRHRSLWY
jgi:hypothetical protein